MRRTSCGSGVPWVSWSPTSTVSPSPHEQAGTLGDRELQRLGPVVGGDDDLAGLVGVVDRDATGDLGDRRLALGLTGLEQLDDARQTVGDVVTGHTTGVEGTHGQLRAGLTDRLGRDGADRLADVDELAGGQRPSVALGAGSGLGLTGEDRADPHLLDAGCDQLVDLDVAEVATGLDQHVLALRVR